MHVMKRWTKDARDVLPNHLVQYQKENLKKRPLTYRHSAVYMRAMELVRLGDASADAYETLMDIFDGAIVRMAPFNEARDGLGLEDRQDEARVLVGKEATDINSATISGYSLAGLKAPTKKRGRGRPSSSREKAPYETMSRRTNFCSICHNPGHKRTTCPQRGDEPKTPRRPSKCTLCGLEGHRRTTCSKIMSDAMA